MNKGYKIQNLTTNEWLGLDKVWYSDINKATTMFSTEESALEWLSNMYKQGNIYQIIKVYYSYNVYYK
jgi:hypothetical protein